MKISVNGKEYDSWADVPADVRAQVGAALPDADGDGVPDLIQGRGTIPDGPTTFTSSTISVNGQTYKSIDDVPADVRARLERAGLHLDRTAGPAGPPPLRPGQVLLNGEVVDVDSTPKRRRWWRRD